MQLHYLTQDIQAISHPEMAKKALEGGIKWVQIRVKNQPFEAWKQIAFETKEVCDRFGATCIINDNALIAAEIGADGVHLGKTDMSPVEARRLLGKNKIIGATANTFEDIVLLAEMKVDYIGLGPFRFTGTKQNLAPILGIEGYERIFAQVKKVGISLPIIGIGGVTLQDISLLKKTGLSGIAISSAINLAENPSEMAAKMLEELVKIH